MIKKYLNIIDGLFEKIEMILEKYNARFLLVLLIYNIVSFIISLLLFSEIKIWCPVIAIGIYGFYMILIFPRFNMKSIKIFSIQLILCTIIGVRLKNVLSIYSLTLYLTAGIFLNIIPYIENAFNEVAKNKKKMNLRTKKMEYDHYGYYRVADNLHFFMLIIPFLLIFLGSYFFLDKMFEFMGVVNAKHFIL